MRRLLFLLIAAGCTFNPTVPPASVFCTSEAQCQPGERCAPLDAVHRICCAGEGCPVAVSTGGLSQEGSISSLGGLISAPEGIRIYDDGFETSDPACAGAICVTGGITP
jgi:hypothetical protein